MFAKCLLIVSESTGADNTIDWPVEHVMKDNSLQSLANHVYNSLDECIHPASYFNERAILAVHNDIINNLNTQLFQHIPGETIELFSTDTVIDDTDATECSIKILNKISDPGLPPHKLTLKVGCLVMLLWNLAPRRGLCNGTRLLVKSISKHIFFCTYLGPSRAGPEAPADGIILLPYIYCQSAENISFIDFDRKQFPVYVCFAITINKSQDQSLKRVGIYLNSGVFSHSQLYVALSRTTNPDNLWIADDVTGKGTDDSDRILLNGHIKNIIYDEVFFQLAIGCS